MHINQYWRRPFHRRRKNEPFIIYYIYIFFLDKINGLLQTDNSSLIRFRGN
jgi:hypothetical protein